MTSRPYRVFVSPWGNIFIRELAELLAAGLADLGRDVTVVEEGLPDPTGRSVDMVVAPFDYFTLHRSFDEAEMWRAAGASVAVTTEQPGTVWLERSLPWLAASRVVLDLDTHAAGYLRSLGIPARRLRLGYHGSWDRWGGEASKDRPTDVAFLGSMTDRRERFLVDAAPRLWDRACELRLFEITTPKKRGDPGFFVGAEKWDRLAATKLLVNVHRGDAPYFEWLRSLDALCNGCVLLTEPSLDPEPLVPGTHVVFAPGALLADYAVGLLADPGLLRRIAADAYELIRSQLRMTDLLRPAVEEMETTPLRSGGGGGRVAVAGLPVADRPAPAPDAATLARQDVLRRVGPLAKRLVLAERRSQRLLDAIESRRMHGDDGHEETSQTAGWNDADAEVSVVIPYDSTDRLDIAGTLAGVAAAVGVRLEIIVVDDHAGGDTAGQVREWMAPRPGQPMTFVHHSAARGRAAAWRSGLAHVRAPWVVLLDAGTVPYPNSLARLRDAAVAEGADLAWGLVVRDGPRPGIDGFLAWDVARLCGGNFLATPVVVRASALSAVGGPDEVMTALGGWEQWDLWLHLAARGCTGALVAGFVARTGIDRSDEASFLDLDNSVALAHLRARYPSLPWPSPVDALSVSLPAEDTGVRATGDGRPGTNDAGSVTGIEDSLAELRDLGEARVGWLQALVSGLREGSGSEKPGE